MNATEHDESRAARVYTSSTVIVGLLLVAAGVALLLERVGALPAPWRLGVWPVLLMAYGVARLTRPTRRGREGLFFVLAGAWWFAGTAGWISPAITWRLLIVARGASLVVQALTTPPRTAEHAADPFKRGHRGMGWVVLLILLGAALTSGMRGDWLRRNDLSLAPGGFRSVTIMGRRTTVVPSEVRSGEVIAIMGRNSVDFRQAKVAPGSTIAIHVFDLMGTGVITVPQGWIVDLQTVPVMGSLSDTRDADWWSAGGSNRPRASSGDSAPSEPGAPDGTVNQ
jgi:hypothetical protein